MPELPEVETIVRRLKTKLVGHKITQVTKLHKKPWQGDDVVGLVIKNVSRRAKVIRLHLSNHHSILIHLKMTGQLIYIDSKQKRIGGGHPTADFIQSLPSKHTRIYLDFDDNSQLFFNDQRVFGWWKVLSDDLAEQELAVFGPDIVDSSLTVDYLIGKLAKKTTSIKLAILDHTIVAGLGNIYVCDGLHLAKVSPFRQAKSLSKIELTRLLTSLQTVIGLGIQLGGATIKDYRTADGLSGGYQNAIRVYGKENESCLVCKSPIKRAKQGGRSTFYCPQCQKI